MVVRPGKSNQPQLIGQQGMPANAGQMNSQARAMILQQAISMVQQVFSVTQNPQNGNNVINVVPRNVGLIKGFYVEIKATINNTDGANTLTLTPFGLANLLSGTSGILFTDLSNNQRINTAGWHLHLLNCVKGHRIFGSAFTTDNPMASGGGMGSNFSAGIISAPSTIAHGVAGTVVSMLYYVPLAYTWSDLRGSIYANTINATMQLQLTINPNAITGAGTDPTLAVYTGAAGNISSVTCTVYQDYYDQLPVQGNGVVLPPTDLATVYEIKNTTLTSIVVNQDFPIPYTNFRQFLSTSFIFDNGGTLNTGTDVNYISLQSANFTNLFKVDPYLAALWTRQLLNDDMPKGTYYFDTRRKPLSTIQYGNLQMNLNAGVVNAGAAVYTGFEAFGMLNQITGAGSLPAS